MVILLTAIVGVMQSRGQNNLSRANKYFATTRNALALEIKAALFEYKPITSGSVSAEVSKSVKALKSSLANGAAIEKPYARLAKNVSEAATQVKSSTSSLKTQLSALQREIAKAEKKLGK
jgi:phage shock protein A